MKNLRRFFLDLPTVFLLSLFRWRWFDIYWSPHYWRPSDFYSLWFRIHFSRLLYLICLQEVPERQSADPCFIIADSFGESRACQNCSRLLKNQLPFNLLPFVVEANYQNQLKSDNSNVHHCLFLCSIVLGGNLFLSAHQRKMIFGCFASS